MCPHSIASVSTCDPSVPPAPSSGDTPPPAPRKPLRECYEDLGVEWGPDPGVGRLWRHLDYPQGAPDFAEATRDADVGPCSGHAPAPSPAACNTRAENSEGVDYVALTCRYDSSPGTFASLLCIADGHWEDLPHGGYLYRQCRKWGEHVRVYYDGAMEGMGSYCQISGEGCRQLEAAGRIRDWQEFAILCTVTYGLKCVRLDLFRDDRQGLLHVAELHRKFEQGEVTTHAHECERRGKRVKGMKGQAKTDTLNIGSRKSDSYMRIYDKTLESRPKGRSIDDWRAEHGHHIRVELELKRKRAHAAMVRLAQAGFAEGLIAGLIRGFIDFKVSDASGHNGGRVPVWAPWQEFLGGEAKVRLAVDYVQPTLDKALYHHQQQYAPTLAAEFMRRGGDVESMTRWLVGVAVDGRKRMRPKHYRLLERAMGEVAA